MAKYKSEFLNTLEERGFIHQCSDFAGLDKKLSEGVQSAYIGFDATASSLHAGSLVQIMMLYWFQKSGHKPITLMGGGTTKVGDPSGKDESRKLLDDAAINKNIEGIKSVFSKYLTYGKGKTDALMVNNDDWLSTIKYIDFLREYGPHFTINRMMTFDSVKLRLEREQPLTFLEFNYMILQAYDFVELKRRYGTILQMGGSDQWGNIINGVDLAHKSDRAELYALTTPLLTTSSGAKMGKTADGAVWLNADMLKPYDYWQYWRNTEDADVSRFMKLFTTLDIGTIESEIKKDIINAKKILADEATKLCHGEEEAKKARDTAEKAFEQNITDSLDLVLPSTKIKEGSPLKESFIELELVSSGTEFKNLTKQKGVYIKDGENKIAITDISTSAQSLGYAPGARFIIGRGNKKLGIVEVEAETAASSDIKSGSFIKVFDKDD